MVRKERYTVKRDSDKKVSKQFTVCLKIYIGLREKKKMDKVLKIVSEVQSIVIMVRSVQANLVLGE